MPKTHNFIRLVFECTFMVLLCFYSTDLLAQKESIDAEIIDSDQNTIQKQRSDILGWKKYVRGFRKDHNFGLSLGYSKGLWNLHNFGSRNVEHIQSRAQEIQFQYAFHLRLIGSLGYFLGTQFAYLNEKQVQPDFGPPSGWSFPGVLGGFVCDFGPYVRSLAGLSYYLQRWNDLKDLRDDGDGYSISVTTRVLSYNLGLDWFFNLAWALRFQYQVRKVTYIRPLDTDKLPALNSDIDKEERVYSMGLAYHLL